MINLTTSMADAFTNLSGNFTPQSSIIITKDIIDWCSQMHMSFALNDVKIMVLFVMFSYVMSIMAYDLSLTKRWRETAIFNIEIVPLLRSTAIAIRVVMTIAIIIRITFIVA